MGQIPSNPLNEERLKNINDIAVRISTTFTKEYTLAYQAAVVQKVRDDLNASPDPEKRLKERPPRTEPFIAGPAKRDKGKKPGDPEWQQRYLILQADYVLQYRLSETGKVKDNINLRGYWPSNPDIEDHPNAFSLKHYRKRNFAFEVESAELRDKWINLLRTACWRATNYKNPNPCAGDAFNGAYAATRVSLGRYSCLPDDTEIESITGLIFYEVEREVLSDVYREIPGEVSSSTYWRIRKMVDDTVNNAILNVVRPAWTTVQQKLNDAQPKMEEEIKKVMQPIVDKENELKEKVSAAIEPVVGVVINKILTPVIGKLAPAIFQKMNKTYTTIQKEFESLAQKAISNGNWEDAKKDMMYATRYYWADSTWPCVKTIWPLEDDIRFVADLLPGIDGWTLIKELEEQVIKFMQDAVYTFEDDVNTNNDKNLALTRTMEALAFDIDSTKKDFLKNCLLNIILAPFETEALPVCTGPIEPLGALIPDALKTFVDPVRLCEELLTEQVENAISTAFDQAVQ